jgi:hypothetical protein
MDKRVRVLVISILVVIVCATLLASCDINIDENGNTIYDCGTNNFIIVGKSDDILIIAHKETGVMYLFCKDYGGFGGATVMVDADGKPLIWKEYEQEVQNGEDKS